MDAWERTACKSTQDACETLWKAINPSGPMHWDTSQLWVDGVRLWSSKRVLNGKETV